MLEKKQKTAGYESPQVSWMTTPTDVQLKYFLAQLCLLSFPVMGTGCNQRKFMSSTICPFADTCTVYKLVMKRQDVQEHRQKAQTHTHTHTHIHIYIYTSICICHSHAPKVAHSLVPSVCLTGAAEWLSSPPEECHCRPVPTVRPPPIRLSYHNSGQFLLRYSFVVCARSWSIRMSQSYKAQGLLIHDLLRKISRESRALSSLNCSEGYEGWAVALVVSCARGFG